MIEFCLAIKCQAELPVLKFSTCFVIFVLSQNCDEIGVWPFVPTR